jgi:hypothetical protein
VSGAKGMLSLKVFAIGKNPASGIVYTALGFLTIDLKY